MGHHCFCYNVCTIGNRLSAKAMADLLRSRIAQLSASVPLTVGQPAATAQGAGSGGERPARGVRVTAGPRAGLSRMAWDPTGLFNATATAPVGAPRGRGLGASQVPEPPRQAEGRELSKEESMQEWVRENANQNTRRTYDAGWKGFQRYLAEEGIKETDIRACDIAHYLRQRCEADGVAAATLAGARVAIGDALKYTPLKGLHLDPMVQETLRVCMNRAAQSKPKQHVSAELMKAIAEMHQQGGGHQTMDWLAQRDYALMLVMMVAMLRESEAVGLALEDVSLIQSLGGEQGAAAASSSGVAAAAYSGAVAWSRATATSGAVSLYAGTQYPPGAFASAQLLVRQSKTDQARKGQVVPLSANREHPLLCPVRVLHRYMVARNKAGVFSTRLFCTKDGGQMAKSTPCSIVQAMVKSANDYAERLEGVKEKWGPPSAYGSHSMRRGGVTEARRSGVDMRDVQKHGRWESDAVFGYVGPSMSQQLAVTSNIFGSRSAPSTPVKPKEPYYATADEHGQYDHETPTQHANRMRAIRQGNFWLKPKLTYIPAAMLQAAQTASSPVAQQRTAAPTGQAAGQLAPCRLKLGEGAAAQGAAAGASTSGQANLKAARLKKRAADSSDEESQDDHDDEDTLTEHLQMEEWQQGYGSEEEVPAKRGTQKTRKKTTKRRTKKVKPASVASNTDEEGREYCTRGAKRKAIASMAQQGGSNAQR